MASTLNRTGESRPDVLKGHGTRELGPSDSTDSGSDVAGGPGLRDLEPLDLERGGTSEPDQGGSTAGPDIGDSDLDSDSDAAGTGENIAAGRDPVRLHRDVMPDRIVDNLPDLDAEEPDDAMPDRIIEDLSDPDAEQPDEDRSGE